jgi:HSP20 family protein
MKAKNNNKSKSAGTREVVPTTPLSSFRHEVDRLFERFFDDPWGTAVEPFRALGSWKPSLDMSENDKEVTVRIEVPGIDPKDLDITISGEVLTISGEKKETKEEKGQGYHRTERRFGTFRRSVELPSPIAADKVVAEHRDGVLTIRLPKDPKAVAKRIPIQGGP